MVLEFGAASRLLIRDIAANTHVDRKQMFIRLLNILFWEIYKKVVPKWFSPIEWDVGDQRILSQNSSTNLLRICIYYTLH